MKDLLIFPYSGTAIEALECIGENWKCQGFISDDESIVGKHYFGIKVYNREAILSFPNAKILAVHGSPTSFRNREAIYKSLKIKIHRLGQVIHPKAWVSPLASIGNNVLIMAGVVITANAVIGNHVVILPNTVIHHDSIIGDYSLIAANVTIAGNVTIGKNCYIGASSSIKNGINIHPNTMVGIGSNVVNNTTCVNSVLVGNPARFLKKND